MGTSEDRQAALEPEDAVAEANKHPIATRVRSATERVSWTAAVQIRSTVTAMSMGSERLELIGIRG